MKNLEKVFASFNQEDLESLSISLNSTLGFVVQGEIKALTPTITFAQMAASFLKEKKSNEITKEQLIETYQLGLAEAKADEKYQIDILSEEIFEDLYNYFERKSLKVKRSFSTDNLKEICFNNDTEIRKKNIRKAIKILAKNYSDYFEVTKIKKNLWEFLPLNAE